MHAQATFELAVVQVKPQVEEGGVDGKLNAQATFELAVVQVKPQVKESGVDGKLNAQATFELAVFHHTLCSACARASPGLPHNDHKSFLPAQGSLPTTIFHGLC